MSQSETSEQAARSLAEKLVAFADGLGDAERAAFVEMERQLSLLVATEDIIAEQRGEGPASRRIALWYQLILGAGR